MLLLEYMARGVLPQGSGRSLTTAALIFVTFAYFVATLVGSVVAGGISGKRWTAWLIVLFVLAGSAYALTMVSYPLWMQIASLLTPVLAGITASALLRRCPAAGMSASA
jgi:hypothetical protein